MDHALAQSLDAHQGNSLIDHAQVFFRIGSPETCIGRASETDKLSHSHIPHVGLLRQHHANQPAQFLVAERRDLFSYYQDTAINLWLEGRECA